MLRTIQLVMLASLVSTPLAVSAQETAGPLAKQLEATAAGAAARYPAEVLKTFKDAMATVKASGIEENAKQVGDQAIDATLSGWDGETVQLSALWKKGPVVLMWYRGGWCPYCNLQLRAMEKELTSIEGAGAQLVVLTPELPEKAKQTAEANDLSMVALHDRDNELAQKYGLVFKLPETIVPTYRDKIKIGSYNGNDNLELPLSATYVIDRTGTITYAFLDANYTKRAEPADVVAAVEASK
ncbi:peroxiredoxin-like family protein [Aporhodopirellula aestuarii]|uniref:thioredoxin-dependent peroxiredoxin n=1 Tax=Aporhodopirellula aestuarii TaxID=2950107 RepID=A0ABT0TYN6_9BACT|nr:peroxiredoxin-like family protein [Aporhodopirellula aestuarii]MCM2369690.1 AhpC/TSA family protein [Aporhodopirellula aestuarii]